VEAKKEQAPPTADKICHVMRNRLSSLAAYIFVSSKYLQQETERELHITAQTSYAELRELVDEVERLLRGLSNDEF